MTFDDKFDPLKQGLKEWIPHSWKTPGMVETCWKPLKTTDFMVVVYWEWCPFVNIVYAFRWQVAISGNSELYADSLWGFFGCLWKWGTRQMVMFNGENSDQPWDFGVPNSQTTKRHPVGSLPQKIALVHGCFPEIWVCLKIGCIPNEIAIFHRDKDQQNHWV